MTQLYNTLSKTAERLIKKYGYNSAEYIRQIETKNGWKNEFDRKVEKVNIIVLPSSKYSKETYRLQGEKAMSDNNYVAYMPYSGFVPTINDVFTVNGINHTVQSVVQINPNGKNVLFKLELK